MVQSWLLGRLFVHDVGFWGMSDLLSVVELVIGHAYWGSVNLGEVVSRPCWLGRLEQVGSCASIWNATPDICRAASNGAFEARLSSCRCTKATGFCQFVLFSESLLEILNKERVTSI